MKYTSQNALLDITNYEADLALRPTTNTTFTNANIAQD